MSAGCLRSTQKAGHRAHTHAVRHTFKHAHLGAILGLWKETRGPREIPCKLKESMQECGQLKRSIKRILGACFTYDYLVFLLCLLGTPWFFHVFWFPSWTQPGGQMQREQYNAVSSCRFQLYFSIISSNILIFIAFPTTPLPSMAVVQSRFDCKFSSIRFVCHQT